MKAIESADFQGAKVLVRVDFNVPLDESLNIIDDSRIRAALPTIKRIIEGGGLPILMSHLGRPKNGYEERFSLINLVDHIHELTGAPVKFANDCIGTEAMEACTKASPGDVVLLENLRFHPGEKKGDKAFARSLAELGDVYVNDAFGTAHRAHASTTVIAQFFPEKKMFGYLMVRELESLAKVLKEPKRPVAAILGGAKISGKIDTIRQLINLVDLIVIGGGMSYTFIKAMGGNIGASLVDPEKIETAKEFINAAKERGVSLHLPVDSLISQEVSNNSPVRTVDIHQIPDGWIGLDIGPDSIKHFKEVIAGAKTILWNGPMGVFELKNFENGSREIAQAIADATTKGAYSLVGGGDSVMAINQFGLADRVSYVSTGGGALLEYVEGKSLPGVEAILN